jgi:hypothetical protein
VRRALLVLALVATASAGFAQARPPGRPGRQGIEVGRLAWVDGVVERAELPLKREWRRLTAGDPVRNGDTLRTAEAATARVEFGWMSVTLAPSTMLTIPASAVLSTVLEQGRVEFTGEGRDLVKIGVGDAQVRGGGRLVLRRFSGRTAASARSGSFRVRVASRSVEVKAGQGTLVVDGRAPDAAAPLPPAPSALRPGEDVGYVRSGQPVELRWSAPRAASHSVELLALDRDEVLLVRDAGPPPLRLELPWLGTYRWRVSARDTSGLESAPSAHGLVCSVER